MPLNRLIFIYLFSKRNFSAADSFPKRFRQKGDKRSAFRKMPIAFTLKCFGLSSAVKCMLKLFKRGNHLVETWRRAKDHGLHVPGN